MTGTPRPVTLPPTVWACSGWFVGTAAASLVHGRLDALKAAGTVEDFLPRVPAEEESTDFHIRWPAAADASVRVHLAVREVPEQGACRYRLVAEASRPWDWSWPSPLALFAPPTLLWDVCDQSTAGRFGHPNRVPTTAAMRDWLRETTASPWSITVLVHDDATTYSDTPVLEGLPPGLTGRVLEYRVFGAQRHAVNRFLRPTGLQLPPGGALILPSRPPRTGIRPEALTVKGHPVRGRAPLLDAVVRYADEPWPASGRFLDRLHGLRDAWPLESERERLDRVLAALADQRLCMGALTVQYAGQRALADTRKAALDDALKAAHEAEDRERAAVEQLRDVQTRLAALAESVGSGALLVAVRAADERREASERDVEAAEELLDAQTEEILRLRAQLTAAPHRVPVPVPAQRAPVPSGWEELADRARHSFARLLLADITETIRPLRGHPHEPVWIRRTWQTLETLESYAAAKAEHGPRLLPHLAAYLRWPAAATLFPATRHAPGESERLMASARPREARYFPVPRTIHPAGQVFMGEHVRIGSGRPPAPRLHLYDDTSGRTGQIHIGYIGAHLP
ncbi:hypothetical protein [Streptomyces xanthophaeus]